MQNVALIDGQNFYQGILEFGCELDYFRFFHYLRSKHSVKDAFIFLGFMRENTKLYSFLESSGFKLVFKDVSKTKDNKIKGNVDVLLSVFAMKNLNNFDGFVLVTSDGDFAPLLEELINANKFVHLIAPKKDKCSYLLRRLAKGNVTYIEEISHKVCKMKNRPAGR